MTRRVALLVALALLAALAPGAAARPERPVLSTISNRDDLVSGGDVLVQVRVPHDTRLSEPRAGSRKVARKRVSATLYRGLVAGLPVGDTRVVARTTAVGVAAITVTNHPGHGPVFAGPQVWPWHCDTASHGLGAPWTS